LSNPLSPFPCVPDHRDVEETDIARCLVGARVPVILSWETHFKGIGDSMSLEEKRIYIWVSDNHCLLVHSQKGSTSQGSSVDYQPGVNWYELLTAQLSTRASIVPQFH
jgi:hypothetical protein